MITELLIRAVINYQIATQPFQIVHRFKTYQETILTLYEWDNELRITVVLEKRYIKVVNLFIL